MSGPIDRSVDMSMGKRNKITVLSYGPSRSGKTHFAATFPRPIFLSDASEGGWETIRYMDQSHLYEPGVMPEVRRIGKAQDMTEELQKIEAAIIETPDQYKTLVVDSLTFYSDSYYMALEMKAFEKSGGKAFEKRHLYQDLASHLRFLMIRVHNLPLNVVWLCLEKPSGEEGADGGPLLAGQTAMKAPARCDCLFYHRCFQTNASEPPSYEIRTRRFGSNNAGGRDGGALPDPMIANYRELETALGLVPFTATEVKRKKVG